MKKLSLVLMASFCVSCGLNENIPETSEPSIFGGYVPSAGSTEALSTIALIERDGVGCSGTLIGSKLIVTARHCTEAMGDRFQVYFGKQYLGGKSNTRRSVRCFHHPYYSMPRFDISVCILDKDAPSGFTPTPVLPPVSKGGASINKGDSISVAGFGKSSHGRDGYRQILFKVDGSIRNVFNDRGYLQIGHFGGKGACNGDSGGPVYINKEGSFYVIGTVSGPDGRNSNCGNEVVNYGLLPAAYSWMQEKVGQYMAKEGNPGKGGEWGDIYCPKDFSWNKQLLLCTNDTHALGPFTEAMIQKCEEEGGGDVCRHNLTWEKDFAGWIRGKERCMMGASWNTAQGVCVEGDNAFGPFTKKQVEHCRSEDGGEFCDTMRLWKGFFG